MDYEIVISAVFPFLLKRLQVYSVYVPDHDTTILINKRTIVLTKPEIIISRRVYLNIIPGFN